MRHDSSAFRRFGVVLVILMIAVAPVAAQTTDLLSEDYEDLSVGDTPGGWDNANITDRSIEGERSLNPQPFTTAGNAWRPGLEINKTAFFFEGTVNLTPGSEDYFELQEFNESAEAIRVTWNVGSGSAGVAERGSDGNFDQVDTGASIGGPGWYQFKVLSNSTGVHFKTWNINDTEPDSFQASITLDETTFSGGDESIKVVDNGNNGFAVDSIGLAETEQELANGEAIESDLELEVNKWQPFDSTQDYRVILNQTNTTSGNVNLTDVTDTANLTSNNTNIVAVNNTTDQLESFNVTGRTFVNASYDGHTSENVNVTVGDRNISNIGIMPPEQWVNSFLEVDSTTGGHNIGSPMQWILAIVIIMYTGARMAKNPWVGIGAGLLSSILIWILGFVGLGIVLNTVFVGLLLGVMIMRSRSSSGDTIVTVPGSKRK